jgi:hypothetical protein
VRSSFDRFSTFHVIVTRKSMHTPFVRHKVQAKGPPHLVWQGQPLGNRVAHSRGAHRVLVVVVRFARRIRDSELSGDDTCAVIGNHVGMLRVGATANVHVCGTVCATQHALVPAEESARLCEIASRSLKISTRSQQDLSRCHGLTPDSSW